MVSRWLTVLFSAVTELIRTPGVSSTLVGMTTPDEVATNVRATLEAFGILPNDSEAHEKIALAEVKAALAGIAGVSWPSGKACNNS